MSGSLIVACNSGDSSEQKTDNKDTASTEVVVQAEDEKPTIASPRKQTDGQTQGVNITVDYGSPGVKGRKIWGGLESYGNVWRAGANETTSLEFGSDVTVNGTLVPAGKYGFYLIPNESKPWIAIINSDWSREEHGAWGAYNYNPKHDIVRVEIEPEWVEDNQERLVYQVDDKGITLAWEKTRVTIPVQPAGK